MPDSLVDQYSLPRLSGPRNAASLSLLRDALAGSLHGIVVTDEKGSIVIVNDFASTVFAYPAGELIGEPFRRLLVEPEGSDDRWAQLRQCALSGTAIGHNICGRRKGGAPVPLEIGVHWWSDGITGYLIASIVDLTERSNLEARLAAATNAHLGFQRLVVDVVARLSAVEPDAVDDTIADSLRQVGEALQLDCAILWRKVPGQAMLSPSHRWIRPLCSVPTDDRPIESTPHAIVALEQGRVCSFATIDDLPDAADRATFGRYGIRSGAMVPVAVTGKQEPALTGLLLGSTTRQQQWSAPQVERLRLLAAAMSHALARKTSHLELQAALDEIRQLRDRWASENVGLRRQVKAMNATGPIVSKSVSIRRALAQVDQVAPTPATVLLLGETGTGKEVMAQMIHDLSPRRQRSMIRVSCAAIPTALIESELFGRERGAYTGALSRQIGRFEAANQSTLFLDEIGDLPMEVQIKLLRVLQERVIERLGSTQPIKVDVRIIAATNRNLEEAVREKTFREDLFYRLNVFPIAIPPLRERVEDIQALVWNFIDEFSRLFGKTIDSISKESLRDLESYSWPGNVRELRNAIERAVIVATGRHLVIPAPRLAERQVPQGAMTLSALEVDHIRAVLGSTGWRVRGPGGAAQRLGLKPTTLESRMARLGITRNKAS